MNRSRTLAVPLGLIVVTAVACATTVGGADDAKAGRTMSAAVPLPAAAGAKTTTSTIPPAQLFVSAGATGDCSLAAPCATLGAAYARAAPGNVIELSSGRYSSDDLEWRDEATAWQENVVARAAVDADVRFDKLVVNVPRLTITGVTIEQNADLGVGADHSRFERVVVNGPVFVIGANHSAVVASEIRPSGNYDGIQIKPANTGSAVPVGVHIIGNRIFAALRQPSGRDDHVDGIQVLGARDLVIRGNVIHEAASTTLALGPDMGPIINAVVENNAIFQCQPKRPECQGEYAIQVGLPDDRVQSASIRFNTFRGSVNLHGDVRFETNIVTAPMRCTSAMTGNIVGSGSQGCEPANRVASLAFDPDGYRVVGPPSALNDVVAIGPDGRPSSAPASAQAGRDAPTLAEAPAGPASVPATSPHAPDAAPTVEGVAPLASSPAVPAGSVRRTVLSKPRTSTKAATTKAATTKAATKKAATKKAVRTPTTRRPKASPR